MRSTNLHIASVVIVASASSLGPAWASPASEQGPVSNANEFAESSLLPPGVNLGVGCSDFGTIDTCGNSSPAGEPVDCILDESGVWGVWLNVIDGGGRSIAGVAECNLHEVARTEEITEGTAFDEGQGHEGPGQCYADYATDADDYNVHCYDPANPSLSDITGARFWFTDSGELRLSMGVMWEVRGSGEKWSITPVALPLTV